MSILITGGTGYIGSHTAVEILNADMMLLSQITFTTPHRKF